MVRGRRKNAQSVFGRDYIRLIHWPERVLKSVAWIVIVAYLSVTTVNPVVAAVRTVHNIEQQKALEEASVTPAERYAQALHELREVLLRAEKYPGNSALQALALLSARNLVATLDLQRDPLDKWWQGHAQHMQDHHFHQDIITRQQQLEKIWRDKDAQLQKLTKDLITADTGNLGAAQQALLAFLKQEIHDRRANLVDHNNLPWQVQKAEARQPITDAAQLRDLLSKPRKKAPQVSSASRATKANLAGVVATTGTPPTDADLAETIDAPFTADITKKAIDLGKSPLKIYNWVHDNVDFFPSYGSAQGAQDTLDKLSGNAFDQASLLIALLRSSGIPARYVYGTIDLPVSKVMNWVGGAQTASAAQQILSQGGIPNIGLISGGAVAAIRIEHVWVEVYVNYNPGRGATSGARDTWIPLDPSYKQYAFTQGMNVTGNVAFDSQAFTSAAEQGATLNATEGWVQNLNQTNIQSQFSAYQSKLKAYVASQKSNATMGDIFGTQKIVAQNLSLLPGSTPYPVTAVASSYSVIPDSLRHYFRYQLYPANAPYTSPLMDWNIPTAQIAGKKVTISWDPATQNDAAAIESYVPKPHADGTPIQPNEFPTSLPASVNVSLKMRVDGVAVAEGGTYGLGTEIIGAGAYTRYADLSQYDETQDNLVAGQQSALGISVQGISAAQLARVEARLSQVKDAISTNTTAGLNGDAIAGDVLTASVLAYFGSLQFFQSITARQYQVINRPGLSYGFFHNVAQPILLYGFITTAVSFQGVNFDVGHIRQLRWMKNDSDPVAAKTAWINYNVIDGQHSSLMENVVPEQMFVDKSQCQYTDSNGTIVNPTLPACNQGVSAVKAIAIAAQQGQRIFKITQENIATVLPQLQQSSSVIAEVQDAVSAGKTVTIHQAPINASGWTGAGYIETNPDTGTGAYLIEGHGDGGFLKWLKDHGTEIGIGLFFIGIIAAALEILPILIGLIALVITEILIYLAREEAIEHAKCDAAVECINQAAILMAAVAFVLGLAGLAAGGPWIIVMAILCFIYADSILESAANGCNNVACPAPPPSG